MLNASDKAVAISTVGGMCGSPFSEFHSETVEKVKREEHECSWLLCQILLNFINFNVL